MGDMPLSDILIHENGCDAEFLQCRCRSNTLFYISTFTAHYNSGWTSRNEGNSQKPSSTAANETPPSKQ